MNVGRTFLLPLIAHRPISSSSLLTPRDAHMLGGQHTLKFAWVRVRGLVKQQSRNVEQSCMWGCQGYRILAHLFFFFSQILLSYCFFYYCCFLFFWVFLVLSTKVILNVVLSLSRFILSSNLVFICPLHSIFLSIIYVLALVMREAGTQRLKFSCKRSCLVKLCCILKWFFKEENDLIVNKVLDSGGVLSQP